MTMATMSTQNGMQGDSLEQVKQRFALWRAGRHRGEHISSALWVAAVGLVEQYGLQRTAQELRVDCEGLKKRSTRHAAVATSKAAAQFVELFAQPTMSAASTVACIVEMENAKGCKMRVELASVDSLAGLASAFWSVR